MRTTVDIPDPTYRRLKAKAALEGATVRQIILKLVGNELDGEGKPRRTAFPLIRGKERRKLDLTNEAIHDILFG